MLGAALAGGRVTDPAIRDPETVLLREVVKALRDTDEWTPAILPIGEGLLWRPGRRPRQRGWPGAASVPRRQPGRLSGTSGPGGVEGRRPG